MTVPQNTQPVNLMYTYPQHRPQYTNLYNQPVQSVPYQFTSSPDHQFIPGAFNPAPGSALSVEVPQKRKSASPDGEATGPKRPKQATSVDNPPSTGDPPSATPNQQVFTTSSSTTITKESLHSKTNTPASSNSTVEGSAAHNFKGQYTPPAHLSMENVNTIALESSLKLAESKMESPGFEHGVCLDENIMVTTEVLSEFRPREWYSWQTIAAWRASVAIPFTWIMRLPGETWTEVPISRKITDVIGVNYEEKRRHWTLVHLSIENRTVTYYDSYLGTASDDVYNKTMSCKQLIGMVRDGYTKNGIVLPSEDPPMTAEVSRNGLVAGCK